MIIDLLSRGTQWKEGLMPELCCAQTLENNPASTCWFNSGHWIHFLLVRLFLRIEESLPFHTFRFLQKIYIYQIKVKYQFSYFFSIYPSIIIFNVKLIIAFLNIMFFILLILTVLSLAKINKFFLYLLLALPQLQESLYIIT